MAVLSDRVKSCLALPEKTNVLSTSNSRGENNIAMFGSFLPTDDSTMMLMLGNNRTYTNLSENPHAALLVIVPGKTGMQTEGCRIYLKVKTVEDDGDIFDRMKTGVREKVGDAAEILKHLVIFEITGVRPIVDMGQGI
ncbi:MAG: pyridoxamine 5'-phosphate oxidase family protein [Desulfosarcina sp.]|nr:pyridoxamine 5'-phosphate oxidase family protein [Desulfobacterales bacterium]